MTPSLEGRTFRSGEAVHRFHEDREGVVSASYSGGDVLAGSLVGQRLGATLEYAYSQLTRNGVLATGQGEYRAEVLEDGRLRLSGAVVLEELAGDRWAKTRLARPVASLERSLGFYRDLIGLAGTGGFEDHQAYDGAFLALPGGAELELTVGGAGSVTSGEDDLLVLYLPTRDDVAVVAARLSDAGVTPVASANPYWDAHGVTVLDPDGYRVVLAALPS